MSDYLQTIFDEWQEEMDMIVEIINRIDPKDWKQPQHKPLFTRWLFHKLTRPINPKELISGRQKTVSGDTSIR